MPNEKRIAFISHSSVDKIFVNRLITGLKQHNIEGLWYDYQQIAPANEDIYAEITKGISESRYFLVILSPAINTSQWASYEIKQALALKKEIIAVHAESPGDFYALLRNPFVNELLSGAKRKVVDFNHGFESGLDSLLMALDPEVGEQRLAAAIVNGIIDVEDPNDAEYKMSVASLNPAVHLPLLLVHLPELGNSRKLMYRVTKAMTYMGAPAIDPLFDFLALAARPAPDRSLQEPEASFEEDESGDKLYKDTSALDYMRYVILSGGNRSWFAQRGAMHCLIAMAGSNRTLYDSIQTQLWYLLNRAIHAVTSNRENDVTFADDFYDIIRLSIELAGELGENKKIDSFLIYQFATTTLWTDHAEVAKHKLVSYVVNCLVKFKNRESLDYLFKLMDDEDVAELYFSQTRSPNPWEDCFVPFGAMAVEELVRMLPTADLKRRAIILLNLSEIGLPHAQKHVLNEIYPRSYALTDSNFSYLLRALARTGVPDVCNRVLRLFVDGQLGVSNKNFEYDIEVAAARACVNADDLPLIEQVHNLLWRRNDIQMKAYLIKSVYQHKMVKYFDRLLDLFKNSETLVLRTEAAILLSQLTLIDEAALLNQLKFAERDEEAPDLSIALANLKSERAVPGLVHGLHYSFLKGYLGRHNAYGKALLSLGTAEAHQLYQKWNGRI